MNNISKKGVFRCIVHFKYAFDIVSRINLIYQLFNAGIGGSFLNITHNMSANKQCVVKLMLMMDSIMNFPQQKTLKDIVYPYVRRVNRELSAI